MAGISFPSGEVSAGGGYACGAGGGNAITVIAMLDPQMRLATWLLQRWAKEARVDQQREFNESNNLACCTPAAHCSAPDFDP